MIPVVDSSRAETDTPRNLARWHEGENGLELLDAVFHTHVYERHIHEAYAIGVPLRGVQRFWCRGALRDGLAGDVVAINPGEVHDGRSGSDGGYAYRMIYVPVERLRAIVDDALEHRGAEVFANAPILKDGRLATLIHAAWRALAHSADSLLGDALLDQALLTLVIRHAGVRPAEGRTVDARAVRGVRDYLRSRIEDKVRLQELADVAGLSRFQLTRQFQRAFGLPPHAYHLHLKLEEGRRRLQRGLAIGRVAADLGFVDQSHFHRRFKGAFGVTPAQWRRCSGAAQG